MSTLLAPGCWNEATFRPSTAAPSAVPADWAVTPSWAARDRSTFSVYWGVTFWLSVVDVGRARRGLNCCGDRIDQAAEYHRIGALDLHLDRLPAEAAES